MTDGLSCSLWWDPYRVALVALVTEAAPRGTSCPSCPQTLPLDPPPTPGHLHPSQ